MPKQVHRFMLPLLMINVIIVVAGGFLAPLWASYVHLLHGDLRTAGNAIAIFSVVIGVLTCFMGRLENHFHRDELFLVISQAMYVIGYAMYFFVDHAWQLYCLQAWLGLSGSMQSPALYALYQRHMPKGKSTTAWGIWNGFYNIALGLGALISAYLAHGFGFLGVFVALFFIACLGLVFALILWRKISLEKINNLVT